MTLSGRARATGRGLQSGALALLIGWVSGLRGIGVLGIVLALPLLAALVRFVVVKMQRPQTVGRPPLDRL